MSDDEEGNEAGTSERGERRLRRLETTQSG
jgi:hypothetical protein